MTRVRAAGPRPSVPDPQRATALPGNPRATALRQQAETLTHRLALDPTDPVARAEAHDMLSGNQSVPGGLEGAFSDSLATLARITDVATSDEASLALGAVTVGGLVAALPTGGTSLAATVAGAAGLAGQQIARRAIKPVARRIVRYTLRRTAKNTAKGKKPGFLSRVILGARSRYLKRTASPAPRPAANTAPMSSTTGTANRNAPRTALGRAFRRRRNPRKQNSQPTAATRRSGNQPTRPERAIRQNSPSRASRNTRASEAIYRITRGAIETARIAAQLASAAAGAGLHAATTPQHMRAAIMDTKLLRSAERGVLRDQSASRSGNPALPGGPGNRLGRALSAYRGNPGQASESAVHARDRDTAAHAHAKREAEESRKPKKRSSGRRSRS